MSPALASVLLMIGIAGLFLFESVEKNRVSKFLWIPTLWMFFCLSRPFSEWLGMSPPTDMATVYAEGSPVDAAVYEMLEACALLVIIRRRHQVGAILRKNWAICLFFSYAALSISWSDYPFVTLKHWIKGIGDLMMVLIVLTEPSFSDAIKRLVTRLGFVLLPLSVLFIKYYPLLGRRLTLSWTMEPVGVAQQKNGLGELCQIMGLALLWRFRSIYNDRENQSRKRRLLGLGVVLAMVVWLLWMCNSMTSICALSIGSVVMLLATTRAFRRNNTLLHLLIAASLAGAVYALFFQSSGSLIQGLGRNATLTGRTDIWQVVINIPNDSLIGTGYESFWLGSRLQKMWDAFPGLYLNETHNGYIEVLITLGWIGVMLLGTLIATGYRNVISNYRDNPETGSLRIAFFLSAVITGLTEAAFRYMGPPWIVFLLATIALPSYTAQQPDRQPVLSAKGYLDP